MEHTLGGEGGGVQTGPALGKLAGRTDSGETRQ